LHWQVDDIGGGNGMMDRTELTAALSTVVDHSTVTEKEIANIWSLLCGGKAECSTVEWVEFFRSVRILPPMIE
jgi:hypothetical protein